MEFEFDRDISESAKAWMLLEDLRDCANECYNHARFRGTSGLDNYERLTEEADALLNGGEA